MNEVAIAIRFIVALATIGALLAALAFFVRTLKNRVPVFGARTLVVAESVMLPNGAAMHIVRAGNRRLLVGSAAGGVSLLGALDEIPACAPSDPGGADMRAA